MKEKTKKIMAGLGIGLTLAGSGMLMTGCTDMLTQSQMDKILTVVDNSDKFMEETLDLLQESNKNLDSKQALKLYQYSMNRLHLNQDNVWDNLKITGVGYSSHEDSSLNNNKNEMHYFKLSSGVNVLYGKDTEHGVYGYHDSTEEAKVVEQDGWISIINSFEYYAYTSCTGLIDGMYEQFTADDIVYCNLMENNNYSIALAVQNFMDGKFEAIINIEVTQEGYLHSIRYSLIEAGPIVNNGQLVSTNNYRLVGMEINYEYGVLTEGEVQADIDAYNESQNPANE